MRKTIEIKFQQIIESDSSEDIERYCNGIKSSLDVCLQGGLVVSGCKTYRATLKNVKLIPTECNINETIRG